MPKEKRQKLVVEVASEAGGQVPFSVTAATHPLLLKW